MCILCSKLCRTCANARHLCSSCNDQLYLKGNTCIKRQQCRHSQTYFIQDINDVSVRLANGSNQLEGRIEIKLYTKWGTICDDNFNLKAGDVICRMLNMGKAERVYKESHFGRAASEVPIHLDDVMCEGNENDISECSHKGIGLHDCSHLEDVGLRCSGPDHQKSCLNTCVKGYYGDRRSGKCEKCSSECSDCTGSARNCTSCPIGKFLSGK